MNLKKQVRFLGILFFILALLLIVFHRTRIDKTFLLQLELGILFGFGVFAEIMLLIRQDFSEKETGLLKLALILSLTAFLIGSRSKHFILAEHIFAYFVFFSVLFTAFFLDKLMPVINEQTVLFYTIVFWYAFLTAYNPQFIAVRTACVIFIIPTLAAITGCFIHKIPGAWFKVFLFFWFSFISFAMVFIEISRNSLFKTWLGTEPGILTHLQMPLFGMNFIFMILTGCLSLGALVELMPDRLKYGRKLDQEKSREYFERESRWITKKYLDSQVKTAEALFIMLIGGGILGLNYYYRIIPRTLMLQIIIIAVPFIFRSVFHSSSVKN